MRNDPILDRFGIWLHRFVLFILLALLQATALWLWALLAKFHVEWRDLLFWLKAGWAHQEGHELAAIMLDGTLTIGILSTGILYLLIGKWWKKHGSVHHLRGARLDNGEM